MKDEELQESLSVQKVSNATRFKKRVEGKLQPTSSVMLTFQSHKLPEYVKIGYEQFKVSVYIPPIIRCFKCQKLGHVATSCRSSVKCVRCGNGHSFQECPNKDDLMCARCGQRHSAAYKGCVTFKEAKQIQNLKINEGITYAEATKKYRAAQKAPGIVSQGDKQVKHAPDPTVNRPVEETPDNGDREVNEPRPSTENTMISNKDENIERTNQSSYITIDYIQLLSFIVFVINNLETQTTHSNRIQLVVDAAKSCLGITHITPEMIHDILK